MPDGITKNKLTIVENKLKTELIVTLHQKNLKMKKESMLNFASPLWDHAQKDIYWIVVFNSKNNKKNIHMVGEEI